MDYGEMVRFLNELAQRQGATGAAREGFTGNATIPQVEGGNPFPGYYHGQVTLPIGQGNVFAKGVYGGPRMRGGQIGFGFPF